MCGIFGLIKPPKDKVIVDELRDSLANLAHRGPDDTGYFCSQNIGLAHQRLAIFDPSAKGRQPMSYFGLTIVFNGAIYNFPEIRNTLLQQGYSFETKTDTEVILAAYRHWGKDCVKLFNGQWAFAIYDAAKKQLFCSRDRFGIKPFYFFIKNKHFYFSSEIKAFTAIPGWQARLNIPRAVEFLQHQMHDHTQETFFKDVFSLKKSHHLILNTYDLSFQTEAYYQLEKLEENYLSDQEAKTQFRSLLEDSIRLRLRSDVPLGTALSGGLDSSSIALSMQQLSPDSIYTFSIVYPQKEISEKPFLDAVLNAGTFQAQQSSPSFEQLRNLEKDILWQQEEPFNGFGVHAQYALFQMAAHKGIKVMLDGQGADEILAGYEKFFWVLLTKSKHQPLNLLQQLIYIHRKHRLDFRQIWQKLAAYRSKQKAIVPEWLRPKIDKDQLFRRSADHSLQATSRNLLFELGLGALLRYEDKNAMASGIESRVPFLDHRLVEFCLALPASLKIRKGVRKWILRESMKDLLPPLLYKRYDKLGFATPQEKWLAEHRNAYLKSLRNNFMPLEKLIEPDFPFHHLDTLTLWRMDLFRQWMERFQVTI